MLTHAITSFVEFALTLLTHVAIVPVYNPCVAVQRCGAHRVQRRVWGGVPVAGGLPHGLRQVTHPGHVYDGQAGGLLENLHHYRPY